MSEKKPAGRKPKVDPIKVAKWRRENNASIAETAKHFGIGNRTVAKACANQAEARHRWKDERAAQEAQAMDYAEKLMEANWANLQEAVERADRARDEGRWDLNVFLDVMDAAHRLIPPDHRDKRWR